MQQINWWWCHRHHHDDDDDTIWFKKRLWLNVIQWRLRLAWCAHHSAEGIQCSKYIMSICVRLLFVPAVFSPRDALFTKSSFKFTTNSPPETGDCDIAPPRGYALTTDFNITCTPFVDQHQPLTYVFKAGSCDTLSTSACLPTCLTVAVHLPADTCDCCDNQWRSQ